MRNCTVYRTANFVGKKWVILVVLELYRGGIKWKRYSSIKRNLPDVTPKVLSMRLRELEKNGLIERRVGADSFPIKSEYRLTKSGEDFVKIINQLKEWSLKWKFSNRICNSTNCSDCVM